MTHADLVIILLACSIITIQVAIFILRKRIDRIEKLLPPADNEKGEGRE